MLILSYLIDSSFIKHTNWSNFETWHLKKHCVHDSWLTSSWLKFSLGSSSSKKKIRIQLIEYVILSMWCYVSISIQWWLKTSFTSFWKKKEKKLARVIRFFFIKWNHVMLVIIRRAYVFYCRHLINPFENMKLGRSVWSLFYTKT